MRDWAHRHGHALVYDPERLPPDLASAEGLWAGEAVFTLAARASARSREGLMAAYPLDVSPVTDNRPYFYRMARPENWLDSAFPDATIRWLFLVACAAALALIGVPLRRLARRGLTRNLLQHAVFFALCGFAFLLFEASIIQMLSVFVGGPAYSLAVVLVSVLGGYAFGSRLAARIPPTRRSYLIMGAVLFVLFVATLFGLPPLLRVAAPLPFAARVVVATIVTLIPSIVVGMPVPLAMSQLRDQHGDVVAWMWGVSSAFNVLGGMSFVPLSQLWGITGAMAVVAAIYLVANTGIAMIHPQSVSK